MRRLVLTAVVAAGLSASLAAQPPFATQNITAGGADCSTATRCAVFTLGAQPSVTLTLAGTFSATLVFEANSGAGWFTIQGVNLADGSLATGASATGQFAFTNTGLQQVRVRASAFVSGPVSVSASGGYAAAKATNPFLTGLTIGQGTITSDLQAISTTATWNNAAVTFTHWKANVTDTASNAASKLVDLQVGGASQFQVRKDGLTTIGPSNSTSSLLMSNRGRITASADGIWTIQNNASSVGMRMQFGVAPTCTSNCGTSPSIVGVDSSFTVTMGATGVPASGWVITFGATWASAPACTVQMAKAGMAVGKLALTAVTDTTTLTVVTNGTAPANGDMYHVHCFGNRS